MDKTEAKARLLPAIDQRLETHGEEIGRCKTLINDLATSMAKMQDRLHALEMGDLPPAARMPPLPDEPSEAMSEAGWRAYVATDLDGPGGMEMVYRAMVAAHKREQA